MNSIEAGKRYGEVPVGRAVIHLDVSLEQVLPEAHKFDLLQGELPADHIVVHSTYQSRQLLNIENPSKVTRGGLALEFFGIQELGLLDEEAKMFPSKIRRAYTQFITGREISTGDQAILCQLMDRGLVFEIAKPYLLQDVRRRVLYEELLKQQGK